MDTPDAGESSPSHSMAQRVSPGHHSGLGEHFRMHQYMLTHICHLRKWEVVVRRATYCVPSLRSLKVHRREPKPRAHCTKRTPKCGIDRSGGGCWGSCLSCLRACGRLGAVDYHGSDLSVIEHDNDSSSSSIRSKNEGAAVRMNTSERLGGAESGAGD